jgi:Replication protein.
VGKLISHSLTLASFPRERQDYANAELERGAWQKQGLLNEAGKPRLYYAREHYLGHELELYELKRLYKFWRDYKEFLILQKQSDKSDGGVDHETIAVLCSKRGNPVHIKRVKERFRFVTTLENKVLFDSHGNQKTSNVLYLTLTYNPKNDDVLHAWRNIGEDWNRYITNLRNKYGNISHIRVFESFANGYPHVHAILVFKTAKFNTYRHKGKWRIKEKEIFEHGYHSFVDVQAVRSVKGGLRYLSKYLLKNQEDTQEEASKRLLSFAMCWLTQRQSFGISREFADLIRRLHDSNFFGSKLLFEQDLGGRILPVGVKWVFIGVKSLNEIQFLYPDVDLRGWTTVLPDCRFEYLERRKGL